VKYGLCCCWLLLATASAATQSDTCVIDFRDGGGRKEGSRVSESADGIEIQVGAVDEAGAHSQFIRWDQIRLLTSDTTDNDRLKRLASGEQLWRGRTRLGRGDLKAARECFTAAVAVLEPTARMSRMMASEGIARTASAARADWSRSLEAALTTAMLRSRFAAPGSWIAKRDELDSEYGLMLSVPPVWMDGDSAKRAHDALAAAADRERLANDLGLAQLLADAGRIAAADAGLAQPPATVNRDAKADPLEEIAKREQWSSSNSQRIAGKKGARLVSLWADAVSSDPAARKRSRQSLAQMTKSAEGKLRLWAIYAEGRSFAMESDPEEVRRGVGKMLLIPAAYGSEIPRLSEAALAQSAIALARIQDDEAAATLRRIKSEYESEFSGRIEPQQGDGY